MDQSTILSRVQKILAKVGNGATEEEAATALAMASKILADHNLTMADVEESSIEWAQESAFMGRRLPAEADFIRAIIGDYFFVRTIELRPAGLGFVSIRIFGEREALGTALWIWKQLTEQYRALYRSYRARAGFAAGDKISYYMGLTHGLSERLEAERKARADEPAGSSGRSCEIVLADAEARVTAALGRLHPDLMLQEEKPRAVEVRTMEAGLGDAAKICLARPVDGRANPEALALPRPD